jgi:hypothetical protein
MAVSENSLKNLKNGVNFKKNTAEKQTKIARAGGIASGVAKRRNKTFKECAQIFGALPADDRQKELLKRQGVTEEATHNMGVVYGLYAAAMRGNSNAARVLLELVGELKQQQTNVNVSQTVNPYANLTEEELRKLAKGE